ncbi:MAG: crotonase/enoyl-CoA hydratase family protein [Acidimicrobiia bacterium]
MTDSITIERTDHVAVVWLDRPEKLNALSPEMWSELPRVVEALGREPEVRVVVVRGRGSAFTVGIDLHMLASIAPEGRSEAERRRTLLATIKSLQRTFSALADCPKPVIAAVHGYCLGAGIDLITACDIRWAAADATFSVRETRMGLVADVGTMQRLPRIIGPGHVAELVFTGTDIGAERALEMGLVSRVLADEESLHKEVMDLAAEIASNSPLVVEGAKAVLRAGEGRSIEQALDYMALWNAAFLISDDLDEAVAAHLEKRSPRFTGT